MNPEFEDVGFLCFHKPWGSPCLVGLGKAGPHSQDETWASVLGRCLGRDSAILQALSYSPCRPGLALATSALRVPALFSKI